MEGIANTKRMKTKKTSTVNINTTTFISNASDISRGKVLLVHTEKIADVPFLLYMLP